MTEGSPSGVRSVLLSQQGAGWSPEPAPCVHPPPPIPSSEAPSRSPPRTAAKGTRPWGATGQPPTPPRTRIATALQVSPERKRKVAAVGDAGKTSGKGEAVGERPGSRLFTGSRGTFCVHVAAGSTTETSRPGASGLNVTATAWASLLWDPGPGLHVLWTL